VAADIKKGKSLVKFGLLKSITNFYKNKKFYSVFKLRMTKF